MEVKEGTRFLELLDDMCSNRLNLDRYLRVCVFPDDRLLALISLFASIPFPSDDEPQPLQVI